MVEISFRACYTWPGGHSWPRGPDCVSRPRRPGWSPRCRAQSPPSLIKKIKLDKDYANKEGTDIGTDGQMNEVQNHYSQREKPC